MKAYDLLVQCETALASITGAPEQPGRVGVSVADIGCGMNAYAGILEALMRRERTGEGSAVKTSLFGCLAEWMTVPLLHYEHAGAAPDRPGLHHPSIAPYGVYASGTGKPLVIAIQNEREWQGFCTQVLNKSDLATDAKFINNVARCRNRPALDALIAEIFSTINPDELVRRLKSAMIAFAFLNEVEDLAVHPQLVRVTVQTPSGPVHLPAPPNTLDGQRAVGAVVPRIGEHDAQIRAEFGA